MEDDDPAPTYEKPNKSPIFRRDRHLASALTRGEIDYLLNNWDNPRGLKKEHILLKQDTQDVTFLSSSQYIHWALIHVSSQPATPSSVSLLLRHMRVANDATILGHRNYAKIDPVLAPPVATPLLAQIFTVKKYLARVVDDITFSRRFRQEYTFFGCKAVCYGNLHVVWTSDRFAYLITHSHFLAVRDCVNSWFSCLAYAYQNSKKYPGYNLYNEVANVITSVLRDTGIYKDDIYDLLKSWQPLVIGTILKYMESDPSFLLSMTETITTYQNSYLLQLATRPLTTHVDCQVALELTGLTKSFGHPEVVMDDSVAAWFDKGTVRKENLEEIGELARSAFVLEFSRNYFKTKRRWPTLVFQDGADPRVRECYEGGYWGELPSDPWTPEMFANVVTGPTLAFDYQVYTADLLSDKSVIPGRDHWIYEFDTQAHRTIHGYFPKGPPRESGNVILQYISRESVNVREIVDIIATGHIPKKWKVCIGVAKEREMKKRKARFFGKMTLEMRLYQVATENNIKNVFKYIPHQTMTKSEDGLMKHLIKMANSPDDEEGGYVFISIDFSSWCTSFRWEGVTPLMEELDRLLGLHGVFSFTQRFPLMCVLLFQDRFNPPRQGGDGDPVNGPRCIHGPEAWMEGLRQKGWTLLTILLILIASWKCNTVATLTGQGDNQVIYLRIPARKTLEDLKMTKHEYITWFQMVLRDLCTGAGITMKLEETWVSGILLEYGREFFLKGAQVSSALKRISRVASEANQTIPSINGDLAGVFSTGMAAAQKDHHPVAAYWTTIVEASFTLQERFPELARYPVEYLTALVSTSRILGGFPVTLFANFCTRSVQDPLTSQLCLIKTFLESPRHRPHMLKIATTLMSRADPKMLVQDPLSLPLRMPRQPENYIKDKITEGLPSLIKNRELIPLFGPEVEDRRQELLDDLMRIRPCNPKLLSKLMTLSNVGKQDALVRKFSNTRSIQAIACRDWNSEADILKKIRDLEDGSIRHILSRQTDKTLASMTPATCTTLLAQELREIGWGIPIEGVTMAAQQEQTTVCGWNQVDIADYTKTITLTMRGDPTLPWDISRGPVPPYIGAPTKVKAKRQPLQDTESYSFNQALLQALQLRSWVKGDEGMTGLIDALIGEKTQATPEELDRRTAHVYSGSITHRLPCPTMNRGGQSNSTSNLSSHIQISSSTATDFAKQGIDYTICFQSVFLYGVSVAGLLYRAAGVLPDKLAIVLDRGCCIWTIEPEVFSLDKSIYKGVPIPTAMAILPESAQRFGEEGLIKINPTESYHIHLAFRFAMWILNRRDTARISALENRAIDEISTPPFVNLSETSRLDVVPFMKYLITYLLILDPFLIGRLPLLLNDIRKAKMRTGFDDLIDTFSLSGLTHRFCKETVSSVLDLEDHEGWRITLCDYIMNTVGEDQLKHITTWFCILPDEEDFLLRKWIRATISLLGEYIQIKTRTKDELLATYQAVIDELRHKGYTPPPLRVCSSEEESVASIRHAARPVARGYHDIPDVPSPLITHNPSQPVSEERERLMHCLDGGRGVNHLYEMCRYLRNILEDLSEGPLCLVTSGDKGGRMYSVLYHSIRGALCEGFPMWRGDERDSSRLLETGPIFITGDSCAIPYSHIEFLANMGDKGPLRLREDVSRRCLFVTKDQRRAEEVFGCPGVELVLVRGELERCPGRLVWECAFQRVEGQERCTMWRLYSKNVKMRAHARVLIGLGNGTFSQAVRRPVHLAMYMQATRMVCLSPMTPVLHILRGLPINKRDLVYRM
ncbi:RNA-dependent RNA polymerase, partial [Orinoco virus]